MSEKWFPGIAKPVLLLGLGLSLLFHLVCGFYSEGYQNHDEHFRILEMMHKRVTAPPTRESFERTLQECPECLMFSYFQPATLAAIRSAVAPMGLTSPFALATLFRLISAVMGWLSLVAMTYLVCQWIADTRTKHAAFYALCFLWFFPYLHARNSPESWAGSFLAFSLALLQYSLARAKELRPPSRAAELGVGAFWALAFSSRYQTGVCVAFIALWYLFVGKRDKAGFFSFLTMCAGFFLVALPVEGINAWGYGQWYPTHYAYLDRLVFKGGVLHQYDSGPWFYLYNVFAHGGPPFSALLIVGPILGWILFPRHVLTWMTASFVIVHQIMAHKQINYLFPIAKMAVVLSVMSLTVAWNRITSIGWANFFRKLRPIALGMNIAMLILACISPSAGVIGLYHFLYNYNKPVELLSVDGDCFEVVGYPVSYYRQPGTVVTRVPSYSELENKVAATDGVAYVGRKGFALPAEAANLKQWCKLSYTPLPTWVARFNYNKWIERSRLWSIYECEKPQG